MTRRHAHHPATRDSQAVLFGVMGWLGIFLLAGLR
jgi:hypothetical protein